MIGKEATQMVSKQKLCMGLILAFLMGSAAGMAMGWIRGFQSGTSFILNEALFKDARSVGSSIAILKDLRAGKRDQAIEGLEVGLNDTLIVFDPNEPYADLKGETVAALRKAINEAKEYRTAHPRKSNQRNLRDEMVQNLFARELYK